MNRRETVVAYLSIALMLSIIEIAVRFALDIDAEFEPRWIQPIDESVSVVAPCVVSWRFAKRAGRVASKPELLALSAWCLLAQAIADVLAVSLAAITGVLAEVDLSWVSLDLAPLLLIPIVVRYAFTYLILWLVLRFPGSWIARARLRNLGVAA